MLEVDFYRGLDPITVHSVTIEELFVTGWEPLRGLDIVAPLLKNFTLLRPVDKDFSMSLLAPKVENILWNCGVSFYPEKNVVIDVSGMWRLKNLKLQTEECGFVLSLDVGRPVRFHSFDILLLFYVQSPGNFGELFNFTMSYYVKCFI